MLPSARARLAPLGFLLSISVTVPLAAGCSDDRGDGSGGEGGFGTGPGGGLGTGGFTTEPPAPACEPAPGGGSEDVAAPELALELSDSWEEAWLGSPAVVDLDGDGSREVVAARGNAIDVWSADGALRWRFDAGDARIWSSPVVANLTGDARLEVAVAAGDSIYVVDADGQSVPGFPASWVDELRSLAAGDVDGDGQLDLVVAPADSGDAGDVMMAFRADGSAVAGFPPNATGTSGCDDKCYVAGCYDQNVALADLDGDGKADVVVPHDNAYASFHKGTGAAFDAAEGFAANKTPGVRYLHDLALAQQGYADDEETALQAHFTNTPPAIADVDGDGEPDILLLASVQNAAQSDREQGVALWALRPDASRVAGWETPFHAPDYLAGLWDFEGTNVVGATNQVSVGDIDPARPGPEMVFAGFDGRIHAVAADKSELFAASYTSDASVLTGGVVIGDLSGDGRPEIAFTSYSPDDGKGNLFILDAGGNELHRVQLPGRGAMPVPALGDVDGDGTVDIVVSLKDAEDDNPGVLVYRVPGSAENCLLWPTGRGNLQRNGFVPPG
jgi:outer membrane protein assembly factor BamB